MTKLWKFTACGIGWRKAEDFYFTSREEAEAVRSRWIDRGLFVDPVKYAGRYSDQLADHLIYCEW